MKTRTLESFMGQHGEFTGTDGELYQCLVTGVEAAPWDGLLTISYVRDGAKIEGAVIGPSEFRPHETFTEGGWDV